MSALTASVSVRKMKGGATTFEILLGKKRLGYVGLAQPGGKAPISWLTKGVGGVEMSVPERVELIKQVRLLMTDEWTKHEAAQQELRDLENGLSALEAGEPSADDTNEQGPGEGPTDEPSTEEVDPGERGGPADGGGDQAEDALAE